MQAPDRFEAEYLIETPLEPAAVAEIMAGEQSCGTFTRVAGETDELRARARAKVQSVEELEPVLQPSLPNAWLERRGTIGPYRRARVRISFPVGNVGPNLPSLVATVAGNLFDLGEVTGLRLETLALPPPYRDQFDLPSHGLAGTRRLTGVATGPLVGSIIKPNVGLSAEETASIVGHLCAAGLDFIKDDEICANPECAPLARRIPAVMAAVRRHQDRTGKAVMMAFNITDETDAMRRHADLVEREGGSCVMASLNWCGFSAVQTLRRHCGLVLHGHRNGYGGLSRQPQLGIGFQAYQLLWRLAGVDHMHVHGLQGKFAQADAEVVSSAHDCQARLSDTVDDRVMPAFSSGQWAGTAPPTYAALGNTDLLFMSGGGIMAHPGGPTAGVVSIRQAWDAVARKQTLHAYAADHPELAGALEKFGRA